MTEMQHGWRGFSAPTALFLAMGAGDVGVNHGFRMLLQELGLQLFMYVCKPLGRPKTPGDGGLVGHNAHFVALRIQGRHAG